MWNGIAKFEAEIIQVDENTRFAVNPRKRTQSIASVYRPSQIRSATGTGSLLQEFSRIFLRRIHGLRKLDSAESGFRQRNFAKIRNDEVRLGRIGLRYTGLYKHGCQTGIAARKNIRCHLVSHDNGLLFRRLEPF